MSGVTKAAKRVEISPVTLRLTREERARLEALADGMTLSAYIRACIFAENARRCDGANKKLAAEALALLGQSRMASNLNQLAYHANIGALVMDDTAKAQIDAAYEHVLLIRSLLMQSLGKMP